MNPPIFEEWLIFLTSSAFCSADLEKRHLFYRYPGIEIRPFNVIEVCAKNITYLTTLRSFHSSWLRVSLALIEDIIR